ncbi:MAG: AAA family ATPase [Solirubrobacterales bacterium]
MLKAAAPGERGAWPAPATLHEREREESALTAAVERLGAGQGGLSAIEGVAGIGKSSLLAEAAGTAEEAGVVVLRSRGSEMERGLPYGIARQLFEPLLRRADGPSRERLLSGPARLTRRLFEPDADPAPPGADFGALNGLYWLTAALAEEQPVLLCIDDAQWSDPASLRYVNYLARRLQGVPALLCVATRSPDPGPVATLLDDLLAEAEASCGVLRPPPLSEDASVAVAAEILGSPADGGFLRACHRASGGNPLLLRALCRGLRESGVEPRSERTADVERAGGAALAGLVRLRTAQLPPAATRLVRSAAVLGDRAAVAEAISLAELAPEPGLDAFEDLRRANFLRPGREIEFVHPLAREAVLAGMGAGEAARAHAAAAHLLADRGAASERVSEQILRAPPAGDTAWVALLREAAVAALAAGDGRTAVACLRRALDEPPAAGDRLQLQIALAQAETLVDSPAAICRMEDILDEIEEPRIRAGVAATLASHLPSWDPQRTIDIGRAALADLDGRDDEVARHLEALVLTGELLVDEPPISAGIEPKPATGDGPDARRLACLLGYRQARGNSPAAEVAPPVRAAFTGEWTRYATEAGAQYAFGMLVLIAADHEEALDLCEEWEATGRRLGRVATWSGAKMFRALALLARGELGEAAVEAADALEAMEAYGMGGGVVSFAAAAQADAEIAMGELDRARHTLERAGRAPGDPGAVNLHGLALSRARLRAAGGDAAGALEEMLDLGRRFERVGGRNPALLPWRSEAALLASALGDGERARALATEEVALGRAWGAPRALGRALGRAAAVAEAGEQSALLADALSVLAPSPARAELAEAQLLKGLIARQSSPLAAREPLAEALALASACDAAPLERRAREALVAAGARPRRSAIVGPEALTGRERQVAEQAAAGRSNREIAQELFLTKRTVETHLTRVYRKLGIGSRAQLADRLAPPA